MRTILPAFNPFLLLRSLRLRLVSIVIRLVLWLKSKRKLGRAVIPAVGGRFSIFSLAIVLVLVITSRLQG